LPKSRKKMVERGMLTEFNESTAATFANESFGGTNMNDSICQLLTMKFDTNSPQSTKKNTISEEFDQNNTAKSKSQDREISTDRSSITNKSSQSENNVNSLFTETSTKTSFKNLEDFEAKSQLNIGNSSSNNRYILNETNPLNQGIDINCDDLELTSNYSK